MRMSVKFGSMGRDGSRELLMITIFGVGLVTRGVFDGCFEAKLVPFMPG